MATAPVCRLPGTLYFISRRVLLRMLLLLPDPVINRILSYLLGRYAARYDIVIHGYVFMSNHFHLLVTDTRGLLSKFLQAFMSGTARAINSYRGRWENLWSTDGPSCCIVPPTGVDASRRLVYIHKNPVAAGLVSSAKKWPGLISLAHESTLR